MLSSAMSASLWVLLLLGASPVSAIMSPSPSTMCGFSFFPEPMTWADARASCSAIHASLIELRNLADTRWFDRAFDSVVLRHFNGDTIHDVSIWGGLYKNHSRGGGGQWRWLSDDEAVPGREEDYLPSVTDDGPCLVWNIERYYRNVGDGPSRARGSGCEMRAYAVCQHHSGPVDFRHCKLEECTRGSVGFEDCNCGVKMHAEMTQSSSAGSSKARWKATLDVHFLNDRTPSKYCASTGVASFPFTAWHRSEPSGLVAATTSRAATKYDFDAQNLFRLFDEYEAIAHAGLSQRCAGRFREYMCYTMQPNARYDARRQEMHACGVCREVCASFVSECTVEERQSIFDLGVEVMTSDPQTSFLCHVGNNDDEVLGRAIQRFLFPNCTSNFTDEQCTSRDPATCESPSVFPPPVAMFRDFPRLAARTERGEILTNEIADPSLRETKSLELRLIGGSAHRATYHAAGDGLTPQGLTNALTVEPNAKLVLANIEGVLGRSSRDDRRRAEQYTVIMDIEYSAPDALSGDINRRCSERCGGTPQGCNACGELGSCCVLGGSSASPECAVANDGDDFTKWGYEFVFDACISVPGSDGSLLLWRDDYYDVFTLSYPYRPLGRVTMTSITRETCEGLCDDDPFCRGFQIRGCGADSDPCGECRGDCDFVFSTSDSSADYHSWVPDRVSEGCNASGVRTFAKVYGEHSCSEDVKTAEFVCASRSRAACNLPFDWLQGYRSNRYMNNQSTPLIADAKPYPWWKATSRGRYDRQERGTCLLSSFNALDRPTWRSSFDTEGRKAYMNKDLRTGKTNDRCTVLGVIEGCFNGYDALPCGASFAVGRSPVESHRDVFEEYMLHHLPEAPTYEDTWIRVALSVDLVSGYVRAFMNSGNETRKVADESWFLDTLQRSDKNLKRLTPELLRKAYLSAEGNLGLANEMLLATDCFATIKLGALAIHSVALPESQLKLLAGAPGSPMSFLLDVSPRTVTVGEGDTEAAYLTVRLLRPPFGALDVSLSLDGSGGRILVDPPSVRFTADDWHTVQRLGITAVDDDKMQAVATESFVVHINSSEPVVWDGGLNDVVHIRVRDNDAAALIAGFDRSVVRTNATNASASIEDAVSSEREDFRHSFKPPHPDTPAGYACIEVGSESQAIGTITVGRNAPPVEYTLSLGSEPRGTVRVQIKISRLGDDTLDPLIVASPAEVTFGRKSWDVPQRITLHMMEDARRSGGVVVPHSLEHGLQSDVDSQYRTVVEGGVLKAEMLAVSSSVSQASDDGLPAWTAAVFVVVALLLIAAVVLVRRRASAKVKQVIRKTSELRHEIKAKEMKFSSEKKRLEASNAAMKAKLDAASKLVNKVMKEGGTAMEAFELRAADIVYDSPRESLGEGSFGTVYVATFRGAHRVAVKTMRVTKIKETELDKFKAEIVIMAPLRHVNIVRLYGGVWNEGADNLCLVLEYCAKGSLDGFLCGKKGRKYTWKHGLRDFALDVAQGLSYLHHGLKDPLIHRDVKPDNILVSVDEIAKLADFGESTRFDVEGARRNSEMGNDAATMTMVGTKIYCAPEVLLMQRYNESADTFSFSLVMLCLVAGDIRYVRKVIAGQSYIYGWRPPIPEELRHAAPSVIGLIESMWRENFRERPAMEAVVVALRDETQLAEAAGASATNTTVPVESLEDKRRRAQLRYQSLSREEVDLRLLEAETSRDEMARRLREAEDCIDRLQRSKHQGESDPMQHQTMTNERGISLRVTFEYDPDQRASVLGQGAFGTVYAVKSTLDGKPYAMKRLVSLKDEDGSVDSVAMNDLLEEVQKLSLIVRSEYFVHYVTSSIVSQYLFVVMERLHGVEFRDLVMARKVLEVPFRQDHIEGWLKQLAAGLSYLHDKADLIHQDLHNGNVMIVWDPHEAPARAVLVAEDDELLKSSTRVKILDLGLSTFKSEQNARTFRKQPPTRSMHNQRAGRRASDVVMNASEMCGFKAIRAPEMWALGADGLVRYGAKTDVWALALLVCEAVLCCPIEEWYDDRETLLSFGKDQSLQQAKIEEVTEISPPFGKVVRRMLAEEPRLRPSAQQVLYEVTYALQDAHPRLDVESPIAFGADALWQHYDLQVSPAVEGSEEAMLTLASFPDVLYAERSEMRRLLRDMVGAALLRQPAHIGGGVALLRLVRNPHEISAIEYARKMLDLRQELDSATKYEEIRAQGLSLHTLPGSAELQEATLQTNEWIGVDAQGDVVVYERWGAVKPKILMEKMQVEAYARWNAYRWEARAMVLDALSRRVGRVVRYANVIDARGMSFEHRKTLNHAKEFAHGSPTWAVPDLLSTTHFIHVNTFGSRLYGLAKKAGFVSHNAQATTFFVSGDKPFETSTDFAARFGRHSLPATVGGTLQVGNASVLILTPLARPHALSLTRLSYFDRMRTAASAWSCLPRPMRTHCGSATRVSALRNTM